MTEDGTNEMFVRVERKSFNWRWRNHELKNSIQVLEYITNKNTKIITNIFQRKQRKLEKQIKFVEEVGPRTFYKGPPLLKSCQMRHDSKTTLLSKGDSK